MLNSVLAGPVGVMLTSSSLTTVAASPKVHLAWSFTAAGAVPSLATEAKMVSLGPNVVTGSVIFLSGPTALPRSIEVTLNATVAGVVSTDVCGAVEASGAAAGGGAASSFFLQPNSARQPMRTRVVVR